MLDPDALSGTPAEHVEADTAAEDPAQLYYTSGTTGLAKGIVHAHRYLLAHEEFTYCHEVQDGESFHGMGEWAWAAGIAPLLGPWRLGAVQYVYRRERGFDAEQQLAFLSRNGVTNVFTTPTAMRAMMAVADAGTRHPQRFRRVCSAGEPLNPEAIRWFREQFGVTVLDYYGLTESYPLVANYPSMEVREGSMGRPMPGWDVQILDEDESPVATGERGEICLRARSNPHYPLGYWNRPDDTEAVFGGDWFHSKDAAVRDEDGYIWYEGRADDVIIAAGYRVGPFEVESVCLEHPAVREAAAVASPDELRGNVVKAFIVLAEGHTRLGRPGRTDPGPRPRAAVGIRLPAAGRVRGRAAKDADRQDPPHRAAPVGTGARRRNGCAPLTREPEPHPAATSRGASSGTLRASRPGTRSPARTRSAPGPLVTDDHPNTLPPCAASQSGHCQGPGRRAPSRPGACAARGEEGRRRPRRLRARRRGRHHPVTADSVGERATSKK